MRLRGGVGARGVRRRRAIRSLQQGLGLATSMGVCAILIHSFADFNLHIPVNSLWFVILLAFGWVARMRIRSHKAQ